MRWLSVFAALLVFGVLVSSSDLSARKAKKNPRPVSTYDTRGRSDLALDHPLRSVTGVGNTFVLAEYTFDNGSMPDTQGWTSVDATTLLDTFFHVADATEFDDGGYGRLIVLEGSQSLRCGLAPTLSEPYCGWSTLPGYGLSWNQRFESVTFYGDTLTISYQITYDNVSSFIIPPLNSSLFHSKN